MLSRAGAILADCGDIYWVIGGACSGKSTICRALAAERNLSLFDMDAHIYGSFIEHYTEEEHPACRAWFFADKPLAWVLSLSELQFDRLNMAVSVETLDLFARHRAAKPDDRPLLVDGGITHPALLAEVIPAERIVCLEIEDERSALHWNTDDDRAGMKRSVLALPDGEAQWAKFLAFDRLISRALRTQSAALGIALVHRPPGLSVDEMEQRVAGHLWA